jgi:glycoside/pentoside/hexuronide:cation symporter, GPH family
MKEQETATAPGSRPEGRIHFSQLAAYGAGGIIPIALFNIAGILVGLMGNISLGLSAFWLGVILIIPRLWDALSDPVIGHLSDNTRTRWGRRRPYLLIGGILVAVFFVSMWWIPKGDWVRLWFPSETGFQAFQLVYILLSLLLFFTACNLFEIPHGALGMELTTDYHERTRLFSAKSFVGNLFAMSTPWLFALANLERFKGSGNEADGMRYVSIIIAACLIPLSFWWSFQLREPGFVNAAKHEKTPFWHDMKRTASNRNFIMLTLSVFTLAMGFNFVQLLGSYIPIFFVFGGDKVAGSYLLGINGTIWAITGLLAVFPLNWLSPRMGKRNTLAIAISLMCLAQLSKIVCYNPRLPYLIIIPTILLSAGMLFFFTLGASMVGDICDEDELATGYRAEGSYYSIFWWLIKMGTAFASFVAGALIVLTAFDESQVTRVDGLQGAVRGVRSEIQAWGGSEAMSGTAPELLSKTKRQVATARDEARKFVASLEIQAGKASKPSGATPTSPQDRKHELISQSLSGAKATTNRLQQIEARLATLGSQPDASQAKATVAEAIPITLETKLAKAKLSSSELMAHLESQSQQHPKSLAHYQALLQHMTRVNDRIADLKSETSLDVLEQQLTAIANDTIPLTRQTPFTLLMMRVVEIGLPVLLSLISFFFLFQYSLTEKRSREIKELLKQRNEARSKDSHDTPGAVVA